MRTHIIITTASRATTHQLACDQASPAVEMQRHLIAIRVETARPARVVHLLPIEPNGELIVAAALAPRAVELFRRLYALGFPIRKMKLVDDYDASDDASMAADNSSAFNFTAPSPITP